MIIIQLLLQCNCGGHKIRFEVSLVPALDFRRTQVGDVGAVIQSLDACVNTFHSQSPFIALTAPFMSRSQVPAGLEVIV